MHCPASLCSIHVDVMRAELCNLWTGMAALAVIVLCFAGLAGAAKGVIEGTSWVWRHLK